MKLRRLAVSALALFVLAPRAHAHVSVTPKEANRGATVNFAFRVPNEEAPAATVKVELFFPEDVDFTTVTPGPVAGWNASESEASVTWSGGRIEGEDRVEFTVLLAPIPSAPERIVFKVLQTYDNGEVVRWIDIPSGSAEPPHPAPVVQLVGVAPTTTTLPTATTTPEGEDDDGGSAAPLILLAALFVAGVGGGIALFRVLGQRRSA